MSTRPAAGEQPFLTIKILKCRAGDFQRTQFAERQVLLDTRNKKLRKNMNIRIRLHISQLKDSPRPPISSPLIITILKVAR